MEKKKIKNFIDITFRQIKTKLINDWNKPLLLLFMFPIAFLILINIITIPHTIFLPLPIATTSIISVTIPTWLYWTISIVSTLSINYFIFWYLSSKYLNGIFQEERLWGRIYRILFYLPIVICEIEIVKELISITYKGKTLGEFLPLLMLLIVCLILRSSYLVYYKQFRHYLKIYYLVVDIIVLTNIAIILSLIQYFKKSIDRIEDLLIILVIVIGFFGYHFLINSFITRTNFKNIPEQTYKEIKKTFFYTPYVPQDLKLESEDIETNVKYQSHFFGNLFSYLLSLVFLLNFQLQFDKTIFNELIAIMAIYYVLLFIRIFLSKIMVIEKEEFKIIMIIIIITGFVVFLLIAMMINDINQSDHNELNFASISMLLWILPKIVPAIMDNILSQASYFKGVISPKSTDYLAITGFVNIFIYNFYLSLLLLLPKTKTNLNSVVITTYISNSISWSLVLSFVLISVFSFLFYRSKSLYYQINKRYNISIEKGEGSFKFKVLKLKYESNKVLNYRPKRTIKTKPRKFFIKDDSNYRSKKTIKTDSSKLLINDESKKDKKKFIFYVNTVSLIISSTILLTLYTFNKTNDNTFEIIKLSLPIFVPTFLKKLPDFLNFYFNLRHTKIKPTLKGHYVESVIDLNLFLIVTVLYGFNYLKIQLHSPLYLFLIIFGVHFLSNITLIFYKKTQKK